MPKKYIKQALKCRIKKQQKQILENVVKPKTIYRVAVYGTLRKGFHNHRFLKDCTLLGTFQTEPQLQLFSNCSETFPYILKNGHTSVTMEVYEFDDEETKQALDRLEGYNESPTGLYDRETIKTPYGRAYVYFRHTKMSSNDKEILSGCWHQFKSAGL